ncbi:MAG: hypothetical protein KatS3mg020_0004 [Fimbriimonadales bacterium]|nr:MAG: hypothetical protein KatS3mg020_0004 [Fimbriimonadales bacterium]
MTIEQILPKIANRAEIERSAGKPLRTLDAIRDSGYHLVKARDREEYYLAKETDLPPLLVRLGDIAEVRRGFTTGANEFFYLEPVNVRVADVIGGKAGATVRVQNGAGWQGEIETAWLRPVIKSPRELKTLRVRPEDLRYLVLMPPDEARHRLHDTAYLQRQFPHAWAYIQWGERQGYQHNPTCAGRSPWWNLPSLPPAQVLIRQFYNYRMDLPFNPKLYTTDHTFYFITGLPQEYVHIFAALMNSSVFNMHVNVYGRTNQAQGVLTFYGPEARSIPLPNPAAFTDEQRERLLNAFEQMAEREVKSIFEELGLPKPNRDYSNIRPEEVSLERVLPDRRALDAVVFEVLGLSEAEQLAVYRAVVELVKSRLVKARSVMG